MEHGRDAAVTALARDGGVTAWRQIADRLLAEVRAEGLAAGARLPTEAALASRFGVNRHTVRRALAALAAEGVVRATRGSGTFLEAPPLPYPIGARTRFSEIVAATGREPGGSLLAAAAVPADPAVAAMLAVSPGASVLRLVTVRSADGAPISWATIHLALPRFAGIADALGRGGTLSEALAEAGVPDYRRASTRITGRGATALDAERLDLAPGRPVLVIESLNTDAAGLPVQCAVSVFAADRVEIVVES